MSERLTAEDLLKIRERCDGATPGPWVKAKMGPMVVRGPLSVNTRGELVGMPGGAGGQQICECDDLDVKRPNANARFIAHARQDVPRLLDTVARLRVALEGLLLTVGRDAHAGCVSADCRVCDAERALR